MVTKSKHTFYLCDIAMNTVDESVGIILDIWCGELHHRLVSFNKASHVMHRELGILCQPRRLQLQSRHLSGGLSHSIQDHTEVFLWIRPRFLIVLVILLPCCGSLLQMLLIQQIQLDCFKTNIESLSVIQKLLENVIIQIRYDSC